MYTNVTALTVLNIIVYYAIAGIIVLTLLTTLLYETAARMNMPIKDISNAIGSPQISMNNIAFIYAAVLFWPILALMLILAWIGLYGGGPKNKEEEEK